MSRTLGVVIAAVVSTLMVSCGAPSASKIGQSASPSGTAAPSPSRAAATPGAFPVATDVTCPDLSPFGLSRYIERPSDPNRHEAVLCDARQLDRPLALNDLDSASTIGFLSESVVGFLQQSGNGTSDASGAIKTLDLTSQQVATVASQSGYVQAVVWSHDQSMLALMTLTNGARHFLLKRGANSPKDLTPPIQLFGRGGMEGDESLVAFSPDDQYVIFVDTALNRLQVFRTADGGAAYTAPSGAGGLRTMATWTHSGSQMYFRNDSGVYRWDPTSGTSSFAPGVKWEIPVFSPDDRHLAYTVFDSAGTTRIVIRDMANGTTTSSPTMRLSMEFLSNAVLLERVTRPCDNQGPCGPYAPTENTLALRIDTGVEGQLPMLAGWGLDAYVQGH